MSTIPEPSQTSPPAPAVVPDTPAPLQPRDAGNWAGKVDRLELGATPDKAVNLNVTGRRVTSPIQGFGKMWQKTYRVRLDGVEITPEEVVADWKRNFGEFWPRKNWFFGSLEGIKPGDVALLNLHMPLGMKLCTGVLVLYADDDSFTVMTPEGHQFAGFNTFSAFRDADGATVVEIRALVRGSDPLYEVALSLGVGHWMEDRFWFQTLRNLGEHFSAAEAEPTLERVCVDKRRQWRQWRNIWHNALIRSALHLVAAPFRLIAKPFRRNET
jgi:hypothetical protein